MLGCGDGARVGVVGAGAVIVVTRTLDTVIVTVAGGGGTGGRALDEIECRVAEDAVETRDTVAGWDRVLERAELKDTEVCPVGWVVEERMVVSVEFGERTQDEQMRMRVSEVRVVRLTSALTSSTTRSRTSTGPRWITAPRTSKHREKTRQNNESQHIRSQTSLASCLLDVRCSLRRALFILCIWHFTRRDLRSTTS